MLVKIKIPEFTYREHGRIHVCRREADVPANHPTVQHGLKTGILVPVESSIPSTESIPSTPPPETPATPKPKAKK